MKTIPSRNIPAVTNLIVFQMCAVTLSFTKVGKALGLSQGAVSRQIIELEDFLRQELFLRKERSLELTESGTHYAAMIEPLMIGLENATNELRMKHARSGLLRVSISISLCYRWLVPLLPDLMHKHPEILINLDPAFGYNIHEHTKKRDNDISILLSDSPPKLDDDSQLLFSLDCVAMCSPHLLANDQAPSMESLLKLPLLHQKELPNFWRSYVVDAGYPELVPPEGMVIDSLMVTIQSVRSGLGVALLPTYMVEQELRSGEIVVANKHVYRSNFGYYMSCNETRRRWPPLYQFRDWIIAQAAVSIQSVFEKISK